MLELRNVKIHRDLSQETKCFSATIYHYGKRCGTVENSGNGGPNIYHWPNGRTPSWAKERIEFKDEDRRTQDGVIVWDTKQPLDLDSERLDQIIDQLLHNYRILRWLKRVTKEATVYRLPTDEKGEWRCIIKGTDRKVATDIRKKYPNAIIANTILANDPTETLAFAKKTIANDHIDPLKLVAACDWIIRRLNVSLTALAESDLPD